MPSSKSVTVERVRDGQRDVLFSTDLPVGLKLVELSEADHTHLVFGTPEELSDLGLAKAPAKRKSAAKKSAARKSTARKK